MNWLIKRIDAFLNSITMYRLLLYGLIIILAIATTFSFTGVLSTSGRGILEVTAVLVVVSYLANKLFGHLYHAATNTESFLITALILACILPPSTTLVRLGYVALTAVIAVASKFVLSYKHRHIFNPAALAGVVMSVTGLMAVTWWIGSPPMLAFVAVLGLLITRKIHRFRLLMVFLVASVAMLVLQGQLGGIETRTLVQNAILSGPMIFLGTIMLTEPATMPSRHYYQLLYGLLVGTLFTSQLKLGIFTTSPHMVLVLGNIFAFIVNPKFKANLRLKAKNQISAQVYDFVFTPDKSFDFTPGQYLEWTLPHTRVDGRGNRRSFTIASSPTEQEVHLGVKFYTPSSSFKKALWYMKPGDVIAAGQLSGNFTLPTDLSKKLVFIAGGIGITPFRSMAKYLLDTKEQRDIVLFYVVSKAEELAYVDLFKASPSIKFVPIVDARLTVDTLSTSAPDYHERTFYISGPNGLVEAYRELLRHNGVPAMHIISDYFSGY